MVTKKENKIAETSGYPANIILNQEQNGSEIHFGKSFNNIDIDFINDNYRLKRLLIINKDIPLIYTIET